jgi:RNA polymerase primary sigma factor
MQGRAGISFFDDRCVADYLADIQGSEPLTREEEKALFRRIRAGDRGAVNELVRANLKFVVSVCANYRNQGVPLGDLINEGNLGLIRAAHRFDATLEYRFISYAVWWVRQAVLTALAEQGRFLPMSANRVGLIRKVEKTAASLRQTLGREPSAEEVAAESRLPASELEAARILSAKTYSLDRPEPGTPEPEADAENPRAPRATEAVRNYLLGKVLGSMLEDLEERDREIVRLYHGIGLENAYTMKEIGSAFGLTRYQVAEVLKKAAVVLRESPEASHLRRVAEAVPA